jgi:ankyrin repeat protein
MKNKIILDNYYHIIADSKSLFITYFGSIENTFYLKTFGNGLNQLHIAAYCGIEEICREIISTQTSQINSIDNEGFTPLDYALINSKRDIIHLLVYKGAKITKTLLKLDNYHHFIMDLLIEKASNNVDFFNHLNSIGVVDIIFAKKLKLYIDKLPYVGFKDATQTIASHLEFIIQVYNEPLEHKKNLEFLQKLDEEFVKELKELSCMGEHSYSS